ncbi:hypothetical protein ABIA33_006553 [Streptacidiphilus sp. MAP12-16]|jgi:hypothetical protein|uniref:DUF6879 family protein n=1 Tax=Streptacidiphilus sp. MAP12-16 TaxID=3156300 RepID=UPI0035177673
MPQSDSPSFEDLLSATERSAVHLEMRDSYAVTYERADLDAWRETGRWDNPQYWQPWIDLVQAATRRGVTFRRARIVSEPVTEYVRFEHAGTVNNVTAGEEVRWLPRRLASDLCLPGNDFWVFDDRVVRFGHFTGDGDWAGQEVRDEPAVAKLCSTAFEAVWERATPHAEFQV